MTTKTKELIKTVSAGQFFIILVYAFIFIYFLLSASLNNLLLKSLFKTYITSAFLVFSAIIMLFFALLVISLSQKNPDLHYSLIILSPLVLLLLWPPQETNLSIAIPFLVIFLTQITFAVIFAKENLINKYLLGNEKLFLSILILLYLLIFGWVNIQRFDALAFSNRDFAIYNQTFWNTIHGRFFQNSTYGSNFACHNTLFFILLVPFYYILPHPLTLLLLKNIFLVLAAIPFYLISKNIFKDSSVLALVACFLFYPFIVAQNLTPPYEIGYSPLFILFSYYFFKRDRFTAFVLFLLLTLTIKEHLALLAIMFGLYALFTKKSLRWVITPILLGVFWGILSLAILTYSQKIYHPHSDPAWFITSFKRVFLSQKGNIAASMGYIFSHSNMAEWYTLQNIFLLLLPLGIIPPLLSATSILGSPELILNLISDRSALMSPLWHYNIVVSCFVLIGTVEGLKRISDSGYIKKYLKIDRQKLQLLLSVFMLSFVFIHSYTWLEFGIYKKNAAYANAVKEAISLIPASVSVSSPDNIVILVSNREKYSSNSSEPVDDYILIDKPPDSGISERITSRYIEIFRKGSVALYKKQ